MGRAKTLSAPRLTTRVEVSLGDETLWGAALAPCYPAHMSKPPSYSPIALRQKHPKSFATGVACYLTFAPVIFFATLLASSSGRDAFEMFLFLAIVLLAIPTIFLLFGIAGAVRARRINKNDWARANAVADAMNGLLTHQRDEAYGNVSQWASLSSSTILEAERHFDSDIGGKITGEVASRFSLRGAGFHTGLGRVQPTFFGAGIAGHSIADLDVNLTQRTNLLSDALFAVVETRDAQGRRDTVRAVSSSSGGTAAYMSSLVHQAAEQLGGNMTHAGTTLRQYTNRIIGHFMPEDSSYLTDQVKWAKMNEDVTVEFWGMDVGRNSKFVVFASIDGKEALHVYPVQFPELFGRALGTALSASPHMFASRRQRRALTS